MNPIIDEDRYVKFGLSLISTGKRLLEDHLRNDSLDIDTKIAKLREVIALFKADSKNFFTYMGGEKYEASIDPIEILTCQKAYTKLKELASEAFATFTQTLKNDQTTFTKQKTAITNKIWRYTTLSDFLCGGFIHCFFSWLKRDQRSHKINLLDKEITLITERLAVVQEIGELLKSQISPLANYVYDTEEKCLTLLQIVTSRRRFYPSKECLSINAKTLCSRRITLAIKHVIDEPNLPIILSILSA